MTQITGPGDHLVNPLQETGRPGLSEVPPAGNDAVSTPGQTAIFSDSIHGSTDVLRPGSPDLLGPGPGTVRPPVQVPPDVAELWPQLPSAVNIIQNAVRESFQATGADDSIWQARFTEFRQMETQFRQGGAHGQLPDSAEQALGAMWHTMRQLPQTGFSDTMLEGAIHVVHNVLGQAQEAMQTLRDAGGAAAGQGAGAPERQPDVSDGADPFGVKVAKRDLGNIRDLFQWLTQSDDVPVGGEPSSDQTRNQLEQMLQNRLKNMYEMLSTMMKNFEDMRQRPIQNLR